MERDVEECHATGARIFEAHVHMSTEYQCARRALRVTQPGNMPIFRPVIHELHVACPCCPSRPERERESCVCLGDGVPACTHACHVAIK